MGDDVHALKPLRAAVVIIGSEGRGISEALRPCVTYYVTIEAEDGRRTRMRLLGPAKVPDRIVSARWRRAGHSCTSWRRSWWSGL